jgi:ketosteroid isomerase-like protein
MTTKLTAEPKSIVAEFTAARRAGDRNRVTALVTEDLEMVFPRSYRAPIKGDEAIDYFCSGGAAHLLDMSTIKVDVKRVTAEGDIVLVEQSLTSAKTLDGKDYANDYVMVYELRDGRIARVIEHADTLLAARIMGTGPALVLPTGVVND